MSTSSVPACSPAIHREAVDYRYASRAGLDVEMRFPTMLPNSVEQRCKELAVTLKLEFCGIDLKRTPNASYVLFEATRRPPPTTTTRKLLASRSATRSSSISSAANLEPMVQASRLGLEGVVQGMRPSGTRPDLEVVDLAVDRVEADEPFPTLLGGDWIGRRSRPAATNYRTAGRLAPGCGCDAAGQASASSTSSPTPMVLTERST